MNLFLKKVVVFFNFWRIIPIYLSLYILKKPVRNLIIDEMYHWKKCLHETDNGIFLFGKLLVYHKEYRNLLCYRMKNGRSITDLLISSITKLLFPNLESLYIMCPNIGENLFIQHGFSTWISAKSIGSNCWINQQVTIGYTFDSEPPTIGNGVRISAGAKVVGQISIGDNVIIGANAVVVKNVRDNMIVGGVPAKIIGENRDHKLYIENNS